MDTSGSKRFRHEDHHGDRASHLIRLPFVTMGESMLYSDVRASLRPRDSAL
jgi:hypothetical protein